MSEEDSYKRYVKPKLIKDFVKYCKKCCLDFYSCGCILTAHLVMEKLMSHTFKGAFRTKKFTPEQAWREGFSSTDYHSGMSAAMTATMIARYSIRGDEFKRWAKKSGEFMVKWK